MQRNIISKKLVSWTLSSLALMLALSQTVFTYQGQEKPNFEVLKDNQLTQTAFTYQGQLIDASGPANGVYDLQFTLYTAQTKGDELGSIVHGNTVLTNGLFTVQLDFGGDINGHESWLEIAVRPSDSTDAYTVLSPRQRLTPTPYAILAQHDPWSLIGVPVGIVGRVNAVKHSDPLNDNDTPTASTEAAPAAGTPNFIAKFDQFGFATRNSIMFDDGNNVGVGTMAPTQKLDVVGTVKATAFQGDGSALTGVVKEAGDTMTGTLNLPANGLVAGTNQLVLTGGNVGIGTASPGAKLDVKGDLRSNGGGVFYEGISSPSTTLATLQVEHGQSQGEAALLRTASSSGANAVIKLIRHPNASNNFMEGTTSTGPGSFETTKFHIDSGGTFHAGSDFAEALPAKGGKAGYEPGDVLVLSADRPRAVEKAHRPYDVKVAGIYSTRPAVLGAEKDGETRVDPDDIPVAIVGIVPTKVTTENGPIQSGDLLTTSSTAGHAMKASPLVVNGIEIYPTGTILGKALEPLENGTGTIKVLVMLR